MEKDCAAEASLYDVWKVIAKRLKLIAGVVFVSVICATIINLLLPKVYRGEIVFGITSKGITSEEIVRLIGKLDGKKLKRILTKTHEVVTDIKLDVPGDSKDKFLMVIDAKSTKDMPEAVSEFIEYTNNNTYVKKQIEQEKEILSRRLEELSSVIESSTQILRTYDMLLKAGKLTVIGFNPIEIIKRVSDLKIEKIEVEQQMKNLKGVEAVGELVVSEIPVRPKIRMNVALVSMLGIFAGILLAFLKEYREKIRAENEN